MHSDLNYIVSRRGSAGHYVTVLFKPKPWGMWFSPTHVQKTPFYPLTHTLWWIKSLSYLISFHLLIFSLPFMCCVFLDGCAFNWCSVSFHNFLSFFISLTEQTAGCQRLWTVWSFFLISWWWRWAEDWPGVRRRRPSISSSSTESSFSTTASRTTHRCSATTSLTSTQASPSCLVRDQSTIC